ncbi:hypothetical protein EQ500_05960, partial [Lactobacillus sp. XV13L]|nr:hypothetical protein [Lactobacillus sp. XV13L]
DTSEHVVPIEHPAGQEITIPTLTKLFNDEYYAKMSVANHDDFPQGTKFWWGLRPYTILNGPAMGYVSITYPDGKTTTLRVKVNIAGGKQVALQHNAYLYDEKGMRVPDIILRTGSVLNPKGTAKIKGRSFCKVDRGKYVAKGNLLGVKRKPLHNARIYNQLARPCKRQTVKKGKTVTTYGTPVKMQGRKFYAIGSQNYVLANRFKRTKISASGNSKAPINKHKRRLMHSSYIYNSAGHRRNGFILAPGTRVQISKKINSVVGRNFYGIGNGDYIPVRNVTGDKYGRDFLRRSVPIYNRYGQKTGVLRAHQPFTVYGDPFKIKGEFYIIIGRGKLVKSKDVYNY